MKDLLEPFLNRVQSGSPFHLINEFIFIGFSIYSFLVILYFKGQEKTNRFINHFDDTATWVLRIAGILFVIIGIIQNLFFLCINTAHRDEQVMFSNRQYDLFWALQFLVETIAYLVATQIFWFRKIRKIIWIRILIALFFIFDYERLVIFITSMHRDFLPVSWQWNIVVRLLHIFIDLLAFIVIVSIFYFFRRKMKAQLDSIDTV